MAVLIGVAAEALQFMKFVKQRPKLHHAVEVGALVILIVGIAGELLGEAKTISTGDQIAGLLNDKAGAANDRAAKAEKEASGVAFEAERLKRDNLNLEAEIAPRNISDDDAKALINALRPFAGRQIFVKSYLGDSEGRRLLMILSTYLSRAGLKTTPGYSYFDQSSKMSLLEGMELDAPPEQKDLANALQESLSKMSLGMRSQWFTMAPGTPVTLYVGVKLFKIPGIWPP